MLAEQEAIAQAYKTSIHIEASDIAKELSELLTPQLTAFITAVGSDRTIKRWATGEVRRIPRDKEERLRITHTIVRLLIQYDSPRVVRAWFIGMNPMLNDSPAEAIRDRRFQEVLMAAQEFVLDG